MAVLVAYASGYGWTEGIAQRIAQQLQEEGLEAAARPVTACGDAAAYDALVVGSGVYLGRWLKEAREFLSANQAALVERPVWLFSSGPVGTRKDGEQAPDLAAALRASEIAQLQEMAQPRGHQVFCGGFSRQGLRVCHRLVAVMPAAKAVLPEGDFRDWDAIDSWAAAIATELNRSF
jgi:menaquinone-dependent protoporphyrinogen oxidase